MCEKPTPQIKKLPRRAARTAAASVSDREETLDPARAREPMACVRMNFSSAAVPKRIIAGGATLLADVRGSMPDRKPIAAATLGSAPQALAAGCDYGNRMTFSYGRDSHAVPMLEVMVPDRGIKREHGAADRPMPWLPPQL